ncbi:MAG: hypothetical protein A2W99_15960 [Bacteroidetes bacterium GWF2_33_16]|nr:MAG: hypothetical protein A2X00_15305 [Bacteroidetes bacterium GWE2_32_14]OFY02396.1 MAG: hypothetical protein A2W99_15960 [Bacteroidetes bacterium GWF2_33_16]
MKNYKILIYIIISCILGILNALPNNSITNFRDVVLLLAEAIGFIIGAFIISALITLIFSIFDKSILKRFKSVSLLITVIILIIATIGAYLG